MNDMLQVGAVTATHGLAGEVKVFPTTDDARRYDDLKTVWLDTGRGMKELEVERVRYFKQLVIVKFRNYDRIEDIQPFVKKNLYVTRENAVALEENEYFIADLIGMKVFDDQEQLIGTLTDVLETGANDVYAVALCEEYKTLKQTSVSEILLPAIKQCILAVDPQGQKMTVHVLEGLL